MRSDTLGAPEGSYFTATTPNDKTGRFSLVIHPHYKK